MSSFVKDIYHTIYNSGHLSFTAMAFPKYKLPVGQELIFIQISHDIWAFCVFKQLT